MTKGKNKHIRIIILATYLLLTGISGIICAQDTVPKTIYTDTITSVNNSVYNTNNVTSITGADTSDNDSVITEINNASEAIYPYTVDSSAIFFSDPFAYKLTDKNKTLAANDATAFKPNPKTAWKIALVFPGFGQLYNRQYWKLPIVYGGLMGCVYAITWNNKTYQDYKTAYFDIAFDSKNDPKSENPDSWSQSWQDFVSSNVDPATRLHDRNFHNNLKRGKDYFRRYRDLSIIICAGIYAIFVADAYVDAQMFDFDVSPDLSFRVTPEFTPGTILGYRSYGINVCMTF